MILKRLGVLLVAAGTAQFAAALIEPGVQWFEGCLAGLLLTVGAYWLFPGRKDAS